MRYLIVNEKRIRFITSIGVATNIFLNATQTSIVEYKEGNTQRQTAEQQNDFKSFYVSPAVSFGVDYKINSRMNLRVEPTFRYGLGTIIDAPIKAYLWSGGLNITCYYGLK